MQDLKKNNEETEIKNEESKVEVKEEKNNVVEEIYQVSYDISKEKTRKRELRGLLTASKETSCDNLYLITDFHREEISIENKTIQIIPAYDWLIS